MIIYHHDLLDDDNAASRGRDHYATFQSVLMSRMCYMLIITIALSLNQVHVCI